MFARGASKGAGSEARGECRDMGYFTRTISKPPPKPRGLVGYIYVYMFVFLCGRLMFGLAVSSLSVHSKLWYISASFLFF